MPSIENNSASEKKTEANTYTYSRLETKFLIPLVTGQERLERMIKSIYKNQMKMQKAMKQQKVNKIIILYYLSKTCKKHQILLIKFEYDIH